MGCCRKIFFIILTVVVVFAGIQINKLLQVTPVPKLDETWWGPGTPGKEDTSIKPFKINVSDAVLRDLQERLSKHRPFTPPLEATQHQYGINTNLLNKIVDFWRSSYDWKSREKFLNQFPQYTTTIQGLKIHYIHVKPKQTNNLKVLPLLLLHGWPGSVREFYEIIPLLTTPQKGRDFVFEVIAPSLPGYGFSEGAVRPGLGMTEMAVVFKNLMKRVGFERYYVQGGDWGSGIGEKIGWLYPEHVLGYHSNFCMAQTSLGQILMLLGSLYPTLVVEEEHVDKVYPISKQMSEFWLEFGYMHIQSTKPDTVGVGLNDSPVGLAAYILEKFIAWTDMKHKELEDGALEKKFTYTRLLDNVMIYWITNSITTSVRLYKETLKGGMDFVDNSQVIVPAACARFSHELMFGPKVLLDLKFKNLVHVADYDGGHFAAFEVPETLAQDIYIAIQKMEKLR